MFRINRATNSISKLTPVKFSELGFRERNHLQEWLAQQPNALGEELLIIQKEFAGFDETKERLDLLALDKTGSLVVIENKLDDSGRDVVWQCLKYASYCSALTKANIADMYQQYLDREHATGTAREKICEFLGQDDFEVLKLNSGNSQRMIMVAAQFRKEVTSTVLWLRKHQIDLHCFKATPFKDGESLFLNLEQIIPLPEAEEFMIGIAKKEEEEHEIERGQALRHNLRVNFWQKALEALEKAGVSLYADVGPSTDHWLNAGAGTSGVHYTMIFSKEGVRVQFVLSGPRERNKAMFDYLQERRRKVESDFGAALEWRRVDDKKVSMIVHGKAFDGYDQANWPQMVDWLVKYIVKLEATFSRLVPELKQLKVRGAE